MKNLMMIFALVTLFVNVQAQNPVLQSSLAELTGEEVSLWRALAIRNGHDISDPTNYPMNQFRREAEQYSEYINELNYYYHPTDNGGNNIDILHAKVFVDNSGFLTTPEGYRVKNLNNQSQAIDHNDLDLLSALGDINAKYDLLDAKIEKNAQAIVDNARGIKKNANDIQVLQENMAMSDAMNEHNHKLLLDKIGDLEEQVAALEEEEKTTANNRFSYNSCPCELLTLEQLKQTAQDFDDFLEEMKEQNIEFITPREKKAYDRCHKKVDDMLEMKLYAEEKGIYRELSKSEEIDKRRRGIHVSDDKLKRVNH
jgi:HPt (histidine-containing phosphotransfer) domain-containing protein